jgi:hypothetical protein
MSRFIHILSLILTLVATSPILASVYGIPDEGFSDLATSAYEPAYGASDFPELTLAELQRRAIDYAYAMDVEPHAPLDWRTLEVAFSLPVETVSEELYEASVECLVLSRVEVEGPDGYPEVVEVVTSMAIRLPDAHTARAIRRAILGYQGQLDRILMLRAWQEVQGLEGRPVQNVRILEILDESYSHLNPIAATETSVTSTEDDRDLLVTWELDVSYEIDGEWHRRTIQTWDYIDQVRY